MESNVKIRENPVATNLANNEIFKSIFTPELDHLAEIFKKYNYEIRIAGGAVRDLLAGKKPIDLDFATVATPEEMKDMFDKESIRMINANGEKHGTITARINDRENFECTTLRIDVITDGRHAEVEFTKDWLLDANRRDLTINSMFLALDGTVYDYFYGYEDLQVYKVRFVGHADTRIKEDFLRILRYFRFYGRIAKAANEHETETLSAIKENSKGLQSISGERIWTELKKILQGNFTKDILMTMIKCDTFKYIGLPENPNVDELNRLFDQKLSNVEYNSITILAALLHDIEDAYKLHNRLKFSAYERDLLYFIMKFKDATKNSEFLTFQKLCLQSGIGKPRDIKCYVEELAKYHGQKEIWEGLTLWEVPKFPIDGTMLKKHDCPTGKEMGKVFNKLKEIWTHGEFKLSADDLIKQLPQVLKELNLSDDGKMKKAK